MQTTGEIIKEFRLARGLTQEQLAEILELKSFATISKWENDENHPRGKEIKMLCKLFNISSDYLLGLESRDQNIEKQANLHYAKIKVYGKIAAGLPLEAIEDVTEEIICPWLKDDIDTENIFALQVNGDSMNKIVPDKYYAVFKKQASVRTGEIAAVMVNGGDATLKKVHLLSEKIMLEPLSYNPIHVEQLYKEHDDVRIIGKYIGCVSPYEA